MSFLSYTIFTDSKCTVVRQVANLFGGQADDMLRSIRNVLGREPKEGVAYAKLGIRVDRIGSENATEVV